MGLITIEVPQKVNRTYRISSESSGKAAISVIEELAKVNTNGEKNPVKKKLRNLSDVVGILADKPESVEEMARTPPRKKNRNKGSKKDEFREAMNAAFGMWSNRNESTEEIARKLRSGWNRKNGK